MMFMQKSKLTSLRDAKWRLQISTIESDESGCTKARPRTENNHIAAAAQRGSGSQNPPCRPGESLNTCLIAHFLTASNFSMARGNFLFVFSTCWQLGSLVILEPCTGCSFPAMNAWPLLFHCRPAVLIVGKGRA